MKLFVDFSENDTSLNIQFIQTSCVFSADFGEVVLIKTDNIYTGDYNVVPKIYQQVLETKDKVMTEDVTIEIIPLAKTINLSNGYTVTIG